MPVRRLLLASLLLLPLAARAQPSPGAAWPDHPLRLIVPYAPGGYTDTVARLTGRWLEQRLGQSVVVENRAGAGGILGTEATARATPDGYTICMCSVGAVSVAPGRRRAARETADNIAWRQGQVSNGFAEFTGGYKSRSAFAAVPLLPGLGLGGRRRGVRGRGGRIQ